MRYRRLGSTEWMVSEVGLNLRALEGLDEVVAGGTLGAAFAAGVTVIRVDAREHAGSVEPLMGRVTATERPRLVVVSHFERLAEASLFEAQLRAAGARIGKEGYLDVALFSQVPDAGQRTVLDALIASRIVRAWGIETGDASVATQAFEAGARVLFAPSAASEPLLACATAAGAGILVGGETTGIGMALADVRVASAVAEATGAADVGSLVSAATRG